MRSEEPVSFVTRTKVWFGRNRQAEGLRSMLLRPSRWVSNRDGNPGLFSVAVCLCASSAAAAQDKPNRPQAEPAAPVTTPDIVVTARQPPTKRTLDGTTYSTVDNAQGVAGSAADVLNTVPGVTVSPDGTVRVRGSTDVQIYVDGRPSAALNGDGRATALESLSGGSIAGVEVLTNPPVRFDANGGVVLNLVLTRSQARDFHGKVTANVGDRGRRNLTTSVSLKNSKVTASIDMSLRDEVRLTHVTDDRRLLGIDGTVISRFTTIARYTPTHARSANVTGALAYSLSDTVDVGVDATVSTGAPLNTVYEDHRDYGASDSPNSIYRRIRTGSYVSNDRDVSVHYSDKGTAERAKLDIVGQHSETTLRTDRPFTTIYELPPLAPAGERVLNRLSTRIDRVAVDYDIPLGDKWRISSGAEWKREENELANARGAFDPDGAIDFPAPTGTTFDAVQRTAAFHIAATYTAAPWAVEIGERLAYIRVAVATTPQDQSVRREVTGFTHRLSATRDLGRGQLAVRLSHSRERLDPRDLNPVTVDVDLQNRSVGNPFLSPQDVTLAETEYGFEHSHVQAAATLYLRQTDRFIADYFTLLADNVLLGSRQNNGRLRAMGAQLELSGTIVATVRFSVTGNVYSTELATGDAFGPVRRSLISYSTQASFDWDASRKDKLHLDANLQGPELIPLGTRTGTGGVNAVWRHILSPKWTATLTARGIARDASVRTVFRTPVAIGINDRSNDSRAVLAGLTYTLR